MFQRLVNLVTSFVIFWFIIPSYGYAYFAATIIKQMGYTAVSAHNNIQFILGYVHYLVLLMLLPLFLTVLKEDYHLPLALV